MAAGKMEVTQLAPPFKGLNRPYLDMRNPLDDVGKFDILDNWHIHGDGEFLRLSDGFAELGSNLFEDGGSPQNIRMLASYKRTNTEDHFLFVAGNAFWDWYNGGSKIVGTPQISATGNSTTCRIPWVRFRGKFLFGMLSDSTSTTVYGGLWVYDPETNILSKAGVPVPGSAPTVAAGAAGVPNGTYQCYFSFVNADGHESNLSPAGSVTVANQKIDWSNILITSLSPARAGAARKLYRTVASGSTPLLVTTINDYTTTVYTDNVADSALGVAHEGNYTLPPTGVRQIAVHGNRVYLVQYDTTNGNYYTMWASKTDASTGLPNWEAFPSSHSIQFSFLQGSDIFKAVTPIGQAIFAWGGLTGYRMLGDIAVGANVSVETLPWGVGMLSPFLWVMTPLGLVFVDNSKKLRLFNGSDAPKLIGKGAWKYLEALDTSSAGLGPENPMMVYNELYNTVYINLNVSDSDTSGNMVGYNIYTDEAYSMKQPFRTIYYNAFDRKMYAAKSSTSSKLEQSSTSNFQYMRTGSVYNSGLATSIQISPIPGDLCYFGKLVFMVKAQPIVSSVLPMMKVEWSMNDGAWYQHKWLDISKDYLVYPSTTFSTDIPDPAPRAIEGPVKRILEVPIYKTGESLTFRIQPAQNSALTNGEEIYAIFLHWKPLAQGQNDGRVAGSSARIRSVDARLK